VVIEAYYSRNETKYYVLLTDFVENIITHSNPKSHYKHLKIPTDYFRNNKRIILHKNCKYCKQIRATLKKRKVSKNANCHSIQSSVLPLVDQELKG
jgi:hypothetical protein